MRYIKGKKELLTIIQSNINIQSEASDLVVALGEIPFHALRLKNGSR